MASSVDKGSPPIKKRKIEEVAASDGDGDDDGRGASSTPHVGELDIYYWTSRSNKNYFVKYWTCCGVEVWRDHPHSNTIKHKPNPSPAGDAETIHALRSKTRCKRWRDGLVHNGTIISEGSGRKGKESHRWTCCDKSVHPSAGIPNDYVRCTMYVEPGGVGGDQEEGEEQSCTKI